MCAINEQVLDERKLFRMFLKKNFNYFLSPVLTNETVHFQRLFGKVKVENIFNIE